jgi:excisionase family DNA binding protein
MDGKLVPQPAETGVVVALVEAFIATGGRMKATAALLNGKGHVTRRGGPWTDVAVARVLRQEVLQELLPETLWGRCEGLLAVQGDSKRDPGRRPAHLLGGLVRCSCGGNMYLRGEGSAGKFICRDCRSKIPHDIVDRKLLESLNKAVMRSKEAVAEILDDPRSAEVARAVGDREVTIAEIWPSLDAVERRQLLDDLVAKVVVDHDEIKVHLCTPERFPAETEESPLNSSPSSHDLKTPRERSTRRMASVPEQPAREGHSDRLSQGPAVPPKAYRIHQVAELLNLPRSTVYDLVRTGALTSVRTGSGTGTGVVLVPANAVTEFLESKRRRSTLTRRPVGGKEA